MSSDPTVIESSGSTSLLGDGDTYLLEPNGGAAVQLSYNGAPVVTGQFGAWTPFAAEQTASGYEVALRVPGADQYTIWFTDSSGNYLSSPFPGRAASGGELESYETSFDQDLNGDGTIGVPAPSDPTNGGGGDPTVIESSGSTSLLGDGDTYLLEPNGGGAVQLSYNGSPVVVGQFGAWTPFAAEQTASGYEVALRVPGADQYTIWFTDSSGNYLSSPFSGAASGDQLEPYEAGFNNDLNGDGTIGVPSPSDPTNGPGFTVIESSGSTSLLGDGNGYLLEPNGAGAVQLSYNGAPVVTGQFGAWTPFAAEQTASGYEVALRVPGADQYTIWFTDSSGDYLSSPFPGRAASGGELESYETSFDQDLNGDGTIGVPSPSDPTNGADPTVIESSGSTSLLADGNAYLLEPNGGAAVQLSYNGAPVVTGQFGAWAPFAAEQTASGYEVALRVAGADQYTIWFTDSSGNYLSSPFPGRAASGGELEPYETSFDQDLNGDGTIGVPPSSPPQFVYEGTDATGAQVYDVTWSNSGLQPFAVRVLTPQNPSSDYAHSFLYDLPVEGGLAQSTWGSGLDELQKLDVDDQYNTTIVEPIFPIDPWYADSSTDPTVNYETFMADILPQWVDSNFSTTGTEQNLLIGFSKSGYGALDLELKHPSVFSAAAAFDFPADMTDDNQYGGGANYGTQANFEQNYELSDSFVNALKAPFTTQDRILISEGPAFQSEVADFDTLLTSQGVMHTLLNQASDAHSWSSGWLPGAVAGLFGLEKNLNSGAST